MEYEENLTAQGKPQSSQMNDNQNNAQNYNPNQLYEKPSECQNQIDNYSFPMAQENPNDQYFIVPQQQLSDFIKDNVLVIPFANRVCNFIFFLIILISSIILVVFVPTYHKIYYGVVLLFENLLLAYLDDNKIDIIMDQIHNKIIIKVKNFLLITKQKYEFEIGSTFFKAVIYGNKHILFILNNFKNGNEINLNASNIMHSPLKCLYYIKNIDVNKFNGLNQLNNILNEFMGISNNTHNPLNFNINIYMNKLQANLIQYNYIKYLKINEKFFSYYNNSPIQKSFRRTLFKVLLSLLHLPVFITGIVNSSNTHSNDREYDRSNDREYEHNNRDEEQIFYIILIGCTAALAWYYLICYGIIFCVSKRNYLRVDVIYSNDFDRIFIGALNNEENKVDCTYQSSAVFNISDISKFVLQKNSIKDEGFHLSAIYKGSNVNKEICYIKDSQIELEGLIYILNKRINNIGNQQQHITENPPPVPTLY